MNFYEPDFLEEVGQFMNPDLFIQKMQEIGLIKDVTDDYGADCYNLCRNASAYILAEATKSDDFMGEIFLQEVKAIDGFFRGCPHTWLLLGDYYIDLTLKQMFPSSPKLAITLKDEANNTDFYQEGTVMSAFDWSKVQFKETFGEAKEEEILSFDPEISELEDAFFTLNGKTIRI